MLRDVDLSVGSESSLFCSDVVAFNAIFSFYTQREEERERERDCTQPKKKKKKRRRLLSERERVASHSILLSTVQYLYVHPIVLTWVALPEKRDYNPSRMNPVQRDVFSFPVKWLGHSTLRFSL